MWRIKLMPFPSFSWVHPEPASSDHGVRFCRCGDCFCLLLLRKDLISERPPFFLLLLLLLVVVVLLLWLLVVVVLLLWLLVLLLLLLLRHYRLLMLWFSSLYQLLVNGAKTLVFIYNLVTSFFGELCIFLDLAWIYVGVLKERHLHASQCSNSIWLAPSEASSFHLHGAPKEYQLPRLNMSSKTTLTLLL